MATIIHHERGSSDRSGQLLEGVTGGLQNFIITAVERCGRCHGDIIKPAIADRLQRFDQFRDRQRARSQLAAVEFGAGVLVAVTELNQSDPRQQLGDALANDIQPVCGSLRSIALYAHE